jgi:hypothetical protein
MRKLITKFLASALLGGMAANAVAQAPVNADPALWVVKDDDTTVYLFGTVHVLKPGIAWFDGGVKTAFDASGELVMEILQPDPKTAQELVMQRAVDADGPALTAKLTPDDAKAYTAALQTIGLPAPAFDRFEPWFAATALSLVSVQKAGFSAESGVEKQLGEAAKAAGKKLGELETLEQQLGMFDSLPEAQQIAFLNSTVRELPKAGKMLDTMVESWAKGDPEALAAQINRSSSITPELQKVLLGDRNARWADWIARRMDTPGTVFIAVGAGHLAGKDSVQDYLRARNLIAVRIPS